MTDPHILPIPHSINLRTLAGYKTIDGRAIKPNKLLRSGRLSKLTSSDAEQLANVYRVVTVADLRMDDEIRREPDVLPNNVSYYQLPVLPFSDHASFAQRFRRHFSKPENPTMRMYRKMLTDSHAVAAYRDMFELLLNNTGDNQAVLIHCSSGKDRTGVGIMLIEAALGFSDKTKEQDYMLSNVALASVNEIDSNGTDYNQVENMRTQPAAKENFQAVLNTIHDDYHTWSSYLQKQLGIGAFEIATLQQGYLSEAK